MCGRVLVGASQVGTQTQAVEMKVFAGHVDKAQLSLAERPVVRAF